MIFINIYFIRSSLNRCLNPIYKLYNIRDLKFENSLITEPLISLFVLVVVDICHFLKY